IDLILDGGPVAVGVESTIVSCLDTPRLLRPGGTPRRAIEKLLGAPLAGRNPAGKAQPVAPGMLASHYAPRAAVRLDVTDVAADEALLAFGPAPVAGTPMAMLNLSAAGDTVEAAANLFSYLRRLDHAGARAIAVMPIPYEGLGEAINDRLARAAAPR